MKISRLYFLLIAIFLFSTAGQAQQAKRPAATSPSPSPATTVPATTNSAAMQAIKSSPAYAEILLRKTELESTVEDLLVTYTEDFPKLKETRYELGLIQKDMARILALDNAAAARLTLALGKLLVRRAELATDLWSLQSRLGDEHPDVLRARRRIASFEKAIAEILP